MRPRVAVVPVLLTLGAVLGATACGGGRASTGEESTAEDDVVVRGTRRVAEDLPVVRSTEVRSDGSTTSIGAGASLQGTVTLLWVFGDPMDVFDRLAEQMGFGEKVTATRACLVRGELTDRVLTEPKRQDDGPLWCVAEGEPGRLEVRSREGRICLDSRVESPECPVIGLARVERPVDGGGPSPASRRVTLHSEPRWREVLGRADADFSPLDLSDDDVADFHRPTDTTDHIPRWPSPGDRLDERSESAPAIPRDVEVLTPVAGLGECPYGVVVSSSRPVEDVIEDYVGSVWEGDVVRDGTTTFAMAADMSAWARGVGRGSSSTVLLEWGCPT